MRRGKEGIVKPIVILISSLLAAVAAAAGGGEAIAAAPDADQAAASGATAQSRPYQHRMSFPAGALSYFPGTTAITQHGDGLNWNERTGSVSLTVRRPLDYSGGSVRVTLFHHVLDEGDGDISFGVTPVAFSHGNFFETYDGVSTDIVTSPLTGDVLLEQSAVIPPTGLGPFANGDWWYFSITRGLGYSGRLRLMSVSLDYY
jgi:hypothetical protein